MKFAINIGVVISLVCVGCLLTASSRGDNKETAAESSLDKTANEQDLVKKMPLKDIRLPMEYWDTGEIKSVLMAAAADPQEDEINIEELRVEFYRRDGEVDIVMTAEECCYKKDSREVKSDSRIRLEKEDLVISGKGLKWALKKENVKILDDVRVVMKRGIDSRKLRIFEKRKEAKEKNE